MRQLYYTVQILLRGRGSNFIKLVSLTLGLLIGILLFSQIAYELSYENFYKDPENVALGEFYQFNLSSCIRQQNSLTAQFVSFSLANLANIFYPPQFLQ